MTEETARRHLCVSFVGGRPQVRLDDGSELDGVRAMDIAVDDNGLVTVTIQFLAGGMEIKTYAHDNACAFIPNIEVMRRNIAQGGNRDRVFESHSFNDK